MPAEGADGERDKCAECGKVGGCGRAEGDGRLWPGSIDRTVSACYYVSILIQPAQPHLRRGSQSLPMNKPEEFRFRDADRIGFNDADKDWSFLQDCFIDTGDLAALTDMSDPRCIILGRAGVGKTALLKYIPERAERIIEIDPDHLALRYISNSTIIDYVSKLDVNLDIFFILLWRHVFALELIKKHFDVQDESNVNHLFAALKSLIRSPRHNPAIKYLEDYSGKFWETTDKKVIERTTKLETDLTSEVSAKIKEFGFKLSDGEKLTQEQKEQVAERAQSVVNCVQIEQLSKVIDLLQEVFSKDPQKQYLMVIDRLDEKWIEDKVRYRLIRALIETIQYLNRRLSQVKIIITLRVDLLDRVYELTKDHGFQREKYSDLNLVVSWSRERLIELVDKRINKLVRSRYSATKEVKHGEILPPSLDNSSTIDYMIARTLMRPRDIIDYFNSCIKLAGNSPVLTTDMIKRGEGDYSQSRLQSLCDEWLADYPHLQEFIIGLLKGRTASFAAKQLTEAQCYEFCFDYTDSTHGERGDILSLRAHDVAHSNMTEDAFRSLILSIFYKVSIVGLKMEKMEKTSWSYDGKATVFPQQITANTSISVHPCLYRVLGIIGKEK